MSRCLRRGKGARAYLISAKVDEDAVRYLCGAFACATFEAWMQWAAGRMRKPVPYLVAAAG